MASTLWFTDVAANQQQQLNFPGYPGDQTLTSQPGSQNNPLFEGPPYIYATYVWTGNEAVNDQILIAIGEAGWIVNPDGHVASGTTAPATTLTVSIGDTDLGVATVLPVPNPQQILAQPAGYTAPTWVAATAYVVGNVVVDATANVANSVYTCILGYTSNASSPHVDTTHWTSNLTRYSTSIDIHAASGNVAFAGGIQLYGGPPSIVPWSITAGQLPLGLATNQTISQPYQLQNDCWLVATILTANTIVANAVSVFRIPVIAAN